MSPLITHTEVLPAPAALTGIGWMLRLLLPGRDLTRSAAGVDAFAPAQQRQPVEEVLVANLLFGVWSFLATGALLLVHVVPVFALLLWLPAWLALLHALILLPPLVLQPFARWPLARRAQPLMEMIFLLLLACWLGCQDGLFPRMLAGFWFAFIALEACLRVLRAGLRLATAAN